MDESLEEKFRKRFEKKRKWRKRNLSQIVDLVDTATWRAGRDAASRSDPTFTRASQGLRQ